MRRAGGRAGRRMGMRASVAIFAALAVLPASPSARLSAQVYVPPPGDAWETRDPRAANFDSRLLSEAVAFAQSNPIPWSHDLGEQFKVLTARERWPLILGPWKNWEAPS